MNTIKLTTLAIAASVLMGSVVTATSAQAGNGYVKFGFFKGNTHGYGKYEFPSNKHGCKIFKTKWHQTGDRYWQGQYYRCLHSFDDYD